MNAVSCHSDNVDGKLSISPTCKIDFVSSISAASWSHNLSEVLQLMVSKKPPLTSAKIVFSPSKAAATDATAAPTQSSKILNFSSPEDRTNFVNAVERGKKKQDEEAEAQRQNTKLQQDSAANNNNHNSNNINNANNNNSTDNMTSNVKEVDDDDEIDEIITVRRNAWLNNDTISQQVFALLSQVSAFDDQDEDQKINRKSGATRKSSGNSFMETILAEEEQKYFAHPDRQEIGSATVYDALNSLVDPTTQALRPISQATAAAIFKQIPHLASVYTRVVHSAEDEMLFWVSVVRRRLFFSRTKLDSQLAECGPLLCPLTGTKVEDDVEHHHHDATREELKPEGGANDDEDYDDDDADDGKGKSDDDEAIEEQKSLKLPQQELDHMEQRPKNDQIRELQKQQQQQQGPDQQQQQKQKHRVGAASRATGNVSNSTTKGVAALVHELNFASGKSVEDLLTAKRRSNCSRGGEDEQDRVRQLQFGAFGESEKQEAAKQRHEAEQQRQRQQYEGTGHSDSRRRERDDTQEHAQRRDNAKPVAAADWMLTRSLAQKLLYFHHEQHHDKKKSESLSGEWKVVFVGKAPSIGFNGRGGASPRVVVNVSDDQHRTSPAPSPSTKLLQHDDVKPLQNQNQENLRQNHIPLRNVGSSSNFIHGRAAAFLVRVFWRKAKDAFDLLHRRNRHPQNQMRSSKNAVNSTSGDKIQQKLESAITRLRGIRRSLSNVLEQPWPATITDERGPQKEKSQWMDALEQIDQVLTMIHDS